MACHVARFGTLMMLLALSCISFVSSAVEAAETCGWNAESAENKEWEGEFFPGIPVIKYEGPSSEKVLAYKYYNRDEIILGRSMKEWLRFSVAFWHTFRGDGGDPFGSPTKSWPWEDGTNSLAMAFRRSEPFSVRQSRVVTARTLQLLSLRSSHERQCRDAVAFC